MVKIRKSVVVRVIAEFIGVFVLGSVMLSMMNRSEFPFFSAAGTGITLAALALIFGSISGTHLNPAVTFGFLTLRKIPILVALAYIAAQFAGGFVALKVNSFLIGTPIQGLITTTWDWRIVIAEVLGALILTLGISSAISRNYDIPVRAALVGGSLFVGILIASLGSAGILNPAVAVATNHISVSYLIAPVFGGLIGMFAFKFLIAVQSEKN